MDSVNFKAKYIDNAFVQAKTGKNRFIPKEVALLKVDLKSKKDKQALSQICSRWEKKNNLIRLVLLSLESRSNKKHNIYLLSEQEDNFQKLLPSKILGIAKVSDYNKICSLDFLQTNPKYEHTNEKRKIKRIGDAMVDYVLHKAGNRKTYLDSYAKVVEFYKKFGFKVIENEDSCLPRMVYDPKGKK